MSVTGKYSFPGIQKAGAAGLKAALLSTTWGAAIVSGPFSRLTTLCLEFFCGWLANKNLIIVNLGAIAVSEILDPVAFDRAFERGLEKLEKGRDKLSPEEGKAIDDQVILAARRFLPISK